jgi:glycosyltransferase involved in cell wall biosynthesis
VQKQTLTEFELVIVDDASTDDTTQVVAALDDERIRYVRRERNGSAGAARNTGIAAASSDLICFLDDDDEYLPGFLERMAGAFQGAGPEVGFGWCGTRTVRSAEDGREDVIREDVWTPRYASREEAHMSILRSRRIGTNAGFTIHRSVVERIGGFDESFAKAEDTEFLVRLAREFDFIAVPEILVKVHLHDGARLTSYDARMALAYERILAKHYQSIARDTDLLVGYHHKTGWLQYHAGNKAAAREHCVQVLRHRPLHLRTWAVLGLFELFGSWAPRIHVQVARWRSARSPRRRNAEPGEVAGRA